MTWQVSCGHFCSHCLEIRSHVSKGKGQQVMEHNWFPLEFRSSDGKDALQTAQKCCQSKIQSFCNVIKTYRGTGNKRENKWENTIFQRSCLPMRNRGEKPGIG